MVFVQSRKSDILKRLEKRVNFNEKLISKFKNIQLPLDYKKKKSKFSIKNNFKSSYVRKNVKVLKSKILAQ